MSGWFDGHSLNGPGWSMRTFSAHFGTFTYYIDYVCFRTILTKWDIFRYFAVWGIPIWPKYGQKCGPIQRTCAHVCVCTCVTMEHAWNGGTSYLYYVSRTMYLYYVPRTYVHSSYQVLVHSTYVRVRSTMYKYLCAHANMYEYQVLVQVHMYLFSTSYEVHST